MSIVKRIQAVDGWAHGLAKKGVEQGVQAARELKSEVMDTYQAAKENINNGKSFISPEAYAKAEEKAAAVKNVAVKVINEIRNM